MFCKGFGSRFKNFLVKIDKALADNAAIALSITGTLKSFLEGPAVSLGILLTETKVDDAIFQKMMKGLDIAISNLAITATCKAEPSLDAKLKCFIAELKKLHPDLQNSILVKIAAIITAHLDDRKQKQSLYDALVQGTYTMGK